MAIQQAVREQAARKNYSFKQADEPAKPAEGAPERK
jgi:hypothetical protein